MNNILEMIKNEKVEWKKLGDVCECKRGSTITKKQVKPGKVPVIAGGQEPAYYHSESNRIGETITVAGSGVNAGYVNYWNIPIFLSDAFSVHPENCILIKYLYYFLSSKQFEIYNLKKGCGIPHVYYEDLEKIEIPIPSLETQERIVKILDTMVDHFTQLEAELEARNKQYEYYRDKLLSEEYLNKLTKKFGGEINFFDIKSLCKRNRGMKITAKQMNDLDNPDGEVKIFAAGNTIANVSIEDVGEDNIISEPSVIVKSRGNIDFDYYNKRFSHKNEMWSYTTLDKNVLNVKYLYYYLKNNLEYFKDKAVSGKLPQISTGITDNYKLPVPNIEVQNTIVDFLDRFQAIIQDVDGLLPKEIELRQKQYEYYRERLLDFKRDDDE